MRAEPVTSELRAMGTVVRVVIVPDVAPAAAHLLRSVRRRLEDLEARWSRFRPDSEISVLNRSSGQHVAVSWETCVLVECGCRAWRATAGRFDPTVLHALVAAGYDRSFEEVVRAAPRPAAAQPSPGCAGIEVDRDAGTVLLPAGVGFDPGGIGKGLAADLLVTELLLAGARGACVNIGGDLRVEGVSPAGDGWRVSVRHPSTRGPAGGVQLDAGGVASTWRTVRVWGEGGHAQHHLIDPSTGASAETGLAGACAVSTEAWRAEALATAAFLAGPAGGPAVLRSAGAAGFLVADDGEVLAA